MQFNDVPNLDELEYQPQGFLDLYESGLGREFWNFMKRPENLLRMETAAFLERAATEPIAPFLLEEFGPDTTEHPISDMIEHMAYQIMEVLENSCRSSILFKRKMDTCSNKPYDQHTQIGGAKKMNITPEQRKAWRENTAQDPFNRWLDRRVKNADDEFDLDLLYSVARKYGIENRYEHLNRGQQRMTIGNMLRKVVPKEEIIADENAMHERGLIELNDADWSALYEALDRPVMPKPRLAKLLREKVYVGDLGK